LRLKPTLITIGIVLLLPVGREGTKYAGDVAGA